MATIYKLCCDNNLIKETCSYKTFLEIDKLREQFVAMLTFFFLPRDEWGSVMFEYVCILDEYIVYFIVSKQYFIFMHFCKIK